MIKHLCLMAVCWVVSVAVQAADPMRPPGWGSSTPEVKAVAAPQLILQQIYIRDGESSAVINNQLVHTGEQVDGATVVGITADKVRVKFRKKVIELSLLNSMRH